MKLSRAKKILHSMTDMSRFKQATISVGTIGLSSLVLSIFYPHTLVFAICFVVVFHELGHYARGQKYTSANTPVFIPAGPVIFGLTTVDRPDDPAQARDIYKTGPKWGILASAVLGAVAISLMHSLLFFSSLYLALSEIYSITLGSDGRRLSKLNYEEKIQ